MNFKINHILPSTKNNTAGLLSSVENISKALEIYNIRSSIYSSDKFKFLRSSNLLKNIKKENEFPYLIHSHGLWKSQTKVSYKSKRNKIPSIISPHGMLDKWALNQNKHIKKIYWNLFEKNNLKECTCIHALCESEYESIRDLGIKNRIEIIPNGINIPELSTYKNKIFNNNFLSKKISIGMPYLLFLGRIHKKKGIYQLLDAWKNMQDKKKLDVFLVIAGFGNKEKIEKIINFTKIRNVILLDPCFNDDKDFLIYNSKGFILPSFSEGLPMSVLEALSFGKPCLITKECNLDKIFNEGGAIEIKRDVSLLEKSLENWAFNTLHDSKSLEDYGLRGRNLIKNIFSWEIVGKQFYSMYESLFN
jgi:poly(glycerol-phosphate) alpha-glucosyltransferase